MRIIDQIPLGGLFLLTTIFILLAIEGGFRLGACLRARGKVENEAPVATMVQSTLALVAFMVAFAFNVAAERFNERRVLIIEEANAIGTTYLRSDYLPDTNKKEVQDLLRKYLDLRLKLRPESREQILAESEKVQDRLWAQAAIVGKMNLGSPVIGLFINSLNETIDLQSKRVAAGLYSRIPENIWAALYLMVLLGMTATGYQAGKSGTRGWTVSIILTISFSLVMLMIADLDNPFEGFLKANRKPLLDLQQKIGRPSTETTNTQTK